MTRTNFSYHQNLKSIKNVLHPVKKKIYFLWPFCNKNNSSCSLKFFVDFS